MTRIERRVGAGGAVVGLVTDDGAFRRFPDTFPTIGSLLRVRRAELQGLLVRTRTLAPEAMRARTTAPIDAGVELWAAGVTFRRSADARIGESLTPDIYSRVYAAERPELFFKGNARRVAGPGEPVRIRADSTWDVPEPELAVVANASREIVAYTICNDVSSRSIEAENPLYLPQAKVWTGSSALGPALVPAWEVADPYELAIEMRIERDGGEAWSGAASMASFVRRFDDLLAWLFREDDFPDGVILSTGTGLVPPDSFTLHERDVVSISVGGLGTLQNRVVRAGARA